jgi:hypothetical protein
MSLKWSTGFPYNNITIIYLDKEKLSFLFFKYINSQKVMHGPGLYPSLKNSSYNFLHSNPVTHLFLNCIVQRVNFCPYIELCISLNSHSFKMNNLLELYQLSNFQEYIGKPSHFYLWGLGRSSWWIIRLTIAMFQIYSTYIYLLECRTFAQCDMCFGLASKRIFKLYIGMWKGRVDYQWYWDINYSVLLPCIMNNVYDIQQ